MLGVALAGLALAGCAVGNYGTLVARSTHTATALVVDVYSIGVHVRPFPPDAGASAGYRRASFVFPRTSEAAPAGAGWQWFGATLPQGPPLLTSATVVGVETQASSHVTRFTLGYIDRVLTISPGGEVSRLVEIHYDRRDPRRTHVHIEEIAP